MSAVIRTESVSAEQWEFVKGLLRDLEAEEICETLGSHFGQWRLAIKTFRRVEAQRMTLMQPTEIDFAFHKACVADLISFGTLLDIAAREHRDDDLAKHGVDPKLIKAHLADLHNTFDEWHGQVPDTKIQELQKRIFDAAPELNLTNP